MDQGQVSAGPVQSQEGADVLNNGEIKGSIDEKLCSKVQILSVESEAEFVDSLGDVVGSLEPILVHHKLSGFDSLGGEMVAVENGDAESLVQPLRMILPSKEPSSWVLKMVKSFRWSLL